MIKRMILTLAMVTVGFPIAAGVAHGQAGRDACGADVEKFCKDVPAGGGRRYKCLKEHEKDLSESCRKHIADVQTRVRGMHEASAGTTSAGSAKACDPAADGSSSA